MRQYRRPETCRGKTDEVLFAGHKARQSRRAEIEATLTGDTVTFEEVIEDEHGGNRILRTSKRTLPAADGAKSRYMLGSRRTLRRNGRRPTSLFGSLIMTD